MTTVRDMQIVASAQPGLSTRLPRESADLTSQYNTLRRRWKVILLAIGATLAATLLLLLLVAPRYTASTQILFDPRKQNIYQAQTVASLGIAIDTGSVESEVSLIQSFNVLRHVVEALSLDQVREFGEPPPANLLSLLLSRFETPEEPAVNAKFSPAQLLAARRLRDSVTARRVGLTYVIEISATAREPLLAAQIADAVADAYLVEQLEARFLVSKRASDWFAQRLVLLREQLRGSEGMVADFRAQNNLVALPQGATIDKQQVSELSAQLVLARAQTTERRAKFEQAERVAHSGGNSAAMTEMLQSQLVSNLRTQEADIARREADLAAKYAATHPQLVSLRAEHADIRRAIADEIQRITLNYRNEFEVARKREQSLDQSLARFTQVASETDAVKLQLKELEREDESNRVLYEAFLSQAKQAHENTTLDSNDSRVITPALVPASPSFPRKSVYLSLALVLGLLGGIGLAFLQDYIENGFTTAEQLEAGTGLSVLAVLPELEAKEINRASIRSIPEYVGRKPLSRFSESVRSARISIGLSDVDAPPKIVLVTSSIPGEGKSTVAVSLAISAAGSGQKVLLIDADMRHPTASKFFGLENSAGLVDILDSSDLTLESAQAEVHGSLGLFANERLAVLAAGAATKNAPDLLGSRKMGALLRSMRADYDLIIIDTPPITAVADSLVLANQVDKIVFVVEWERTPRAMVQRAMNVLGETRGRVAGIVLNRANVGQMRYHASYYSYYSQAYRTYYQG